MCHRIARFLSHSNILTSSGGHTLVGRIDHHWNVEGDRTLSRQWTVFTKFTPLNTTPLSGHTWSGRERRRCKQRPGPKTRGQKCGQARQRNLCKKKNSIGQKTSRRSNHARRLRGTCYVAPEDKEFNATLKKRERSWKCMWTLQCRANCERNPQGKIRDEHWRGEIFRTHNHKKKRANLKGTIVRLLFVGWRHTELQKEQYE